MDQNKITFIGFGNMGSAIYNGMQKSKLTKIEALNEPSKTYFPVKTLYVIGEDRKSKENDQVYQ